MTISIADTINYKYARASSSIAVLRRFSSRVGVHSFQAIYYGVFSDNRPELALPYFPIIEQMVELGKWRTSVDWLPRAGKCSLPGAFTNYFVSDCRSLQIRSACC